MGLYNRFCKRFFAAVIIRLTAQARALCGSEFKIMGLYNRFCKRFFAAVIVRTTAQADSRAQIHCRRPLFGIASNNCKIKEFFGVHSYLYTYHYTKY